jgi:hypothetical protein
MPPAARSLLAAALRRGELEDQLTVVFAAALTLHHGFAQRVSDLVFGSGADGDAEGAEVRAATRTQVMTPAGRLVDLEIALWSRGRVARRLWCENKVDAAFQPDQLEHYLEALQRLDARGRLVVIAPSHRRADISAAIPAACCFVSWQQIGEAAILSAEAEGGPRWRRCAMDASAPASLRVLADFVDYFTSREGLNVMLEPLKTHDVLALRDYDSAEETVRALFEAAVERSRYRVEDRGHHRRFWKLAPNNGQRAAWGGGYYEFARTNKDFVRRLEATGEPVFFAGIHLPQDSEMLDSSPEFEAWRAGLRRDGWTLLLEDRRLRVAKVYYLAELAVRSATFDEQCRLLSRWLDATLSAVAGEAPAALA